MKIKNKHRNYYGQNKNLYMRVYVWSGKEKKKAHPMFAEILTQFISNEI